MRISGARRHRIGTWTPGTRSPRDREVNHEPRDDRAGCYRARPVHRRGFLAHDTGAKDRTEKDIVNIYGGVRWGWQAGD
jgi:hypothetical protein